jgi:2-oxo-3-hexenedioate decarboxylase/2-keto-4-pentenoate hydratase
MKEEDAEEIAGQLWTQHRNQSAFTCFKESLPAIADGYCVQDAYLALRTGGGADAFAGYKIGLTTPAMQATCGATEPTSGRVPRAGVRPAPALLSLATFGRLVLECELCVILAEDVGGDASAAEVARKLRSIHAAYEVVDSRGAKLSETDAPSLIADNVWHEGVILGLAGPPDLALSRQPARLSVNGAVVERGGTQEGTAHALEMVAWLARHLARRGRRLKAGELVMTGSLFPLKLPNADEVYEFEIGGLAPVTVTVSA